MFIGFFNNHIIFEKLPFLNKSGNTYFKLLKIKNPNLHQYWFDACEHNKINILWSLLQNGAKIDYINEDAETLLHLAFYKRNNRLIHFAIKHGADFKKTNRFEENVFFLSAQSHIPLSIFKLIWTNVENIETILEQKNILNLSIYQILLTDSNIKKVKWLYKHNIAFQKLKPLLFDYCYNQPQTCYFLKGKEDLHKRLKKQLSTKAVTSKNLLKI